MTRRVSVALAATLCLSAFAFTLTAAIPEEDAVLFPIHAMFDGMAHRDAAAIKARRAADIAAKAAQGEVDKTTIHNIAGAVKVP